MTMTATMSMIHAAVAPVTTAAANDSDVFKSACRLQPHLNERRNQDDKTGKHGHEAQLQQYESPGQAASQAAPQPHRPGATLLQDVIKLIPAGAR